MTPRKPWVSKPIGHQFISLKEKADSLNIFCESALFVYFCRQKNESLHIKTTDYEKDDLFYLADGNHDSCHNGMFHWRWSGRLPSADRLQRNRQRRKYARQHGQQC
jgi:hypothetical protein